MFKALIKIIVLFSLLLVNMALFTWGVNHFELGKTTQKMPLIKSVNAQVIPRPPKFVQRIETITQQKKFHSSTTTPSSTSPTKANKWLVLQFQPAQIHLNKAEHVKLENLLQGLNNASSSHSAEIFFGATHFEKNVPSPQMAKLRAQSVARIIYPYTQSVKMHYSPYIKNDKVDVYILIPQKKQVENDKSK